MSDGTGASQLISHELWEVFLLLLNHFISKCSLHSEVLFTALRLKKVKKKEKKKEGRGNMIGKGTLKL